MIGYRQFEFSRVKMFFVEFIIRKKCPIHFPRHCMSFVQIATSCKKRIAIAF